MILPPWYHLAAQDSIGEPWLQIIVHQLYTVSATASLQKYHRSGLQRGHWVDLLNNTGVRDKETSTKACKHIHLAQFRKTAMQLQSVFSNILGGITQKPFQL